MSGRLPFRDEAGQAEPPPNLSPAIIKLAYRLSQLKTGVYDITLLKHDNYEMGVVVTGRGQIEVLKGQKR